MSAEIVWEEPPSPTSDGSVGAADLRLFAEALRSRPGQWARYPRNIAAGTAAVIANNVKNGVSHWKPSGAYQAVTRTVDDRRVVFIRFVGEQVQ